MADLRRNITARRTSKGDVFDVRISIPGKGRLFKGGFKARQAAADWRDQMESAANAEALLRERTLMLPELIKMWIDATEGDKTGATVYSQRSALRVHIRPHLNVPIDHVTGKLMRKFIDELPQRLPKGADNGWSIAKRVVDMVKAALRWAARPDVQLIEHNPLRDVPIRLPRQQNVRRPVAGADFIKLIEATESRQHRLLWYLLGYTGARRGEITALRWGDIDFGESILRIEKIATPESRGRTVEEGRVKAGQIRDVPIDEELLEELAALRSLRRPKDSDYLFPSSRRPGPIGFSGIDRWWEKDCKNAGLIPGRKGYTIHSLRHMFTTLLLDSGEDLKAVSRILGHSDTNTTQNVYRHISDSHKRKSIGRLGKLLRGGDD